MLRLGFVDTFGAVSKFFTAILSEKYDVVRDDVNPDVLFFCDEIFGRKNLEYDRTKVKKIFYTGENRRAKNYACDYSITFDFKTDPKHIRLPLYALKDWEFKHCHKIPGIREIERNASASEKEMFCTFVVRNGGCRERNTIFQKLSKYKFVHSAGPLFNNVGYTLERKTTCDLSKPPYLRKAKFNICYENSSFPGYVTEKLYHALYSNTIPIYWGSPIAYKDFNPRAFISRHNYSSDEEMIEHIIEIDNNDELYDEIVRQPIFLDHNPYITHEQILPWFEEVVMNES